MLLGVSRLIRSSGKLTYVNVVSKHLLVFVYDSRSSACMCASGVAVCAPALAIGKEVSIPVEGFGEIRRRGFKLKCRMLTLTEEPL